MEERRGEGGEREERGRRGRGEGGEREERGRRGRVNFGGGVWENTITYMACRYIKQSIAVSEHVA